MIVPEDKEDLDKLDKYLLSDDSPDNCMMLSDLDGFLTGIACGPEAISPAEWMPVVWGHEPNFADEAQRLEVEAAILKMYDSILETLKDGEWAISPVFWRTVDGVDIVGDWCEGFLEAIHLRIDAWKPIFMHRTHGDLLLPILIHCMTPDGDDYFPSSLTDNESLMEQMPKLIPDAVHGVYRFWRDESLRPESIRSAAKVGRNDPCSCGSGKKFKRCCGG